MLIINGSSGKNQFSCIIKCRCNITPDGQECFWRKGGGRKAPNFKKIKCNNKKPRKLKANKGYACEEKTTSLKF